MRLPGRRARRRTWPALGIAALVVLLAGCGYHNAMTRGEEAAAQKDWSAAAAAYETALRHDPDDEAAARALDAVKRRWHVQSLSRFEHAMARGDLSGARAALRQAEAARPAAQPNAVAAQRLQAAEADRAAHGLREAAGQHQAAGRLVKALRLYAKAQSVRATPAGAAGLTTTIAALEARSAAAEAEGRWAEAEADRAAVAAVDPQRAPAREAVRTRWIAAWIAERDAHAAADRLASAFVRAAQVAALAPTRPDLVTAREALRARLQTPLLLRRTIALDGPPLRVQRVLADLPPALSLAPASPRLHISGALAPIRCDQVEHVKVRSQRYQAGLRVVRNPDWVDARRAVRAARDAKADAERRQHEADRAVWQAEQRLAEKQRDAAKARRRKRRRLRRALDQARDEERRCQDALSGARPAEQSSARGRLERATREVEKAWDALDRFARDRRRDEHAFRALETARDRLANARQRVDRARDAEADAERRLDDLHPTTEVPRYATHRYRVSAWTRSCAAVLRLTVERADAPPRIVEVPFSVQTRDRAHDAQVVLGLDADPLRFPVDDRTLAARLDGKLAAHLRQVVQQARAAWTRSLLARAEQAETSEARAALAVGAVLNGSDADVARRILADAFALDDVAVLRPPAP